MSVYTVNFNLIVREYLPPDKREPAHISWLTALLAPLQTLHDDTYLNYRPDVTSRAKHNGQKIILEDVLNTTFGVVGPQFIYIDNTGNNILPDTFYNQSENQGAVTMYNQSEAQPPLYLNNQSELNNNKQFIVFVPLAVYTAVGEPAIREEVDRLRPYSTIYTIQTY